MVLFEGVITPKISVLRIEITLGLLGLLPDYPDYRSDNPDYRSDNPEYCRITRNTAGLPGLRSDYSDYCRITRNTVGLPG